MVSLQELREWHIVIGWAIRALPADASARPSDLDGRYNCPAFILNPPAQLRYRCILLLAGFQEPSECGITAFNDLFPISSSEQPLFTPKSVNRLHIRMLDEHTVVLWLLSVTRYTKRLKIPRAIVALYAVKVMNM